MKTKIVLGLATLAALALPAMAEDGNRYRDRDDHRAIYTQNYRYDADAYRRYDSGNQFRAYDRDNDWRHEAREQRQRREQMERNREYREHDGYRR